VNYTHIQKAKIMNIVRDVKSPCVSQALAADLAARATCPACAAADPTPAAALPAALSAASLPASAPPAGAAAALEAAAPLAEDVSVPAASVLPAALAPVDDALSAAEAALVVFVPVLADTAAVDTAVAFEAAVAVAVEFDACCTTMQFPKPDSVFIDTTHRSPVVPPVHAMPAGICTVTFSEPSDSGAVSPFCTMLAATKLCASPVPVGSTITVLKSREPSRSRLKFVAVVLNVPSAPTAIGAVLSMFDATSTFPHGRAFVGRCTSARTIVPCTPSAGVMPVCACAAVAAHARKTAGMKSMLARGGG